MGLKTLKDIEYLERKFDDEVYAKEIEYELIKDIRKEAIKWINEDKKVLNRLHEDDVGTWEISIRRWMKRLNITEEDLK